MLKETSSVTVECSINQSYRWCHRWPMKHWNLITCHQWLGDDSVGMMWLGDDCEGMKWLIITVQWNVLECEGGEVINRSLSYTSRGRYGRGMRGGMLNWLVLVLDTNQGMNLKITQAGQDKLLHRYEEFRKTPMYPVQSLVSFRNMDIQSLIVINSQDVPSLENIFF